MSFQIVFRGEVQSFADPQTTRDNFARLFKVDSPEQVEQLFSGRRIVLKKNLSEAEAKAIEQAINKAGGVCEIETMAVPASSLSLVKADSPSITENVHDTGVASTLDGQSQAQAEALVASSSIAGAGLVERPDRVVCLNCNFEQDQAKYCSRCSVDIEEFAAEVAAGKVAAGQGMRDLGGVSNAYEAPHAGIENYDLDTGSMEKALAGDYNTSVGEVISEAWSWVHGSKLTIAGAASLLMIIAIAVAGGGSVMMFGDMLNPGRAVAPVESVMLNLLIVPLTQPLWVGMLYWSTWRASEQDTSFGLVFFPYKKILQLTGVTILSTILIYIGFILLILPGIYLTIAYSFAGLLIVEKNMPIWQAMEASRKAVTKHWFQIFGVIILCGLINGLGMLLLFIGTFWTFPLYVLAMGVMYRRIFGLGEQAITP